MGIQNQINEILNGQKEIIRQQADILELARKHEHTLYEQDTGLMARARRLEVHNEQEQARRIKFMTFLLGASALAGHLGSQAKAMAEGLKSWYNGG